MAIVLAVIILLHGWMGNAAQWDTAKAQYEAAGHTVHALNLPRNGATAGDTRINADYVESYIAANGLTNVQLDGHSLGGILAEYIAKVRANPAVTSVVARDSVPTTNWLYCLFAPDTCWFSAVVTEIRNAARQARWLDMNSLGQKWHADIDCMQKFTLAHNDFLTNTTVTAKAILWAQGGAC